jgi:hypothetical protein
MIRRHSLGVLALALLLPLPARAVIDNSALACGTNAPTYYPRGDRWVNVTNTSGATPWDPTPVPFYIYSGGSADVPADAEKEAIVRAADAWGLVECTAGKYPSVWLDRQLPDYPNRDNGDDFNLGNFKNVVYWVETADDWLEAAQADSNTIALTTNQRATDTGFIATSDMVFNGANFVFRATGDDNVTRGCTPSGSTISTCYDLGAVALHEFGHMLGFNHVQCTDAVMYPRGSTVGQPTALSVHERTGVCAVYPPRSQTEVKATLGELCDQGTDCATGLGCAISSLPGWTVGYCTPVNCTGDAQCPSGYVCRQTGDGDKFCGPGVHGSGDGGTDPGTGLPPDLCAPCSGGDDCSNGMCVALNDTEAVCTMPCGSNDTCPTGLSCAATEGGPEVCVPTSSGSCGGSDVRVELGDVCYDEAANQVYECGPGLVCFVFQPRVEGQIGACVTYCNNFDSPCPDTNQTCCFGIDDNGNCLGYAASRPHGGCFDIRREGETCDTAENSICEAGTECFNFGNPYEAKCFKRCEAAACRSNQECVEWSAGATFVDLCCDAADFSADPTGCVPHVDTHVYDVGVACDVNSDCDSKLCLKHDGEAACSRNCDPYSGFGCPGNIDVNRDGNPDGGFACILQTSGEGRCWPLNGPADPPPDVKTLSTDTVPGTCGCSGTPADAGFLGLGLAVLAVLRRAPCRRRGE